MHAIIQKIPFHIRFLVVAALPCAIVPLCLALPADPSIDQLGALAMLYAFLWVFVAVVSTVALAILWIVKRPLSSRAVRITDAAVGLAALVYGAIVLVV